jgi:hypothetical protein
MNLLAAFAADRTPKSIRRARACASSLASRSPVVATTIRSRGAILDDQFRLCAAIQNNNVLKGGEMAAVLRALAGSGFLIASTILAQAAEPSPFARGGLVSEGSLPRQARPRALDGRGQEADQQCRRIRPLPGAAARQAGRHVEADADRRRRYRLRRTGVHVRTRCRSPR